MMDIHKIVLLWNQVSPCEKIEADVIVLPAEIVSGEFVCLFLI